MSLDSMRCSIRETSSKTSQMVSAGFFDHLSSSFLIFIPTGLMSPKSCFAIRLPMTASPGFNTFIFSPVIAERTPKTFI